MRWLDLDQSSKRGHHAPNRATAPIFLPTIFCQIELRGIAAILALARLVIDAAILEVGKLADLLVLDRLLQVKQVFLRGHRFTA